MKFNDTFITTKFLQAGKPLLYQESSVCDS